MGIFDTLSDKASNWWDNELNKFNDSTGNVFNVGNGAATTSSQQSSGFGIHPVAPTTANLPSQYQYQAGRDNPIQPGFGIKAPGENQAPNFSIQAPNAVSGNAATDSVNVQNDLNQERVNLGMEPQPVAANIPKQQGMQPPPVGQQPTGIGMQPPNAQAPVVPTAPTNLTQVPNARAIAAQPPMAQPPVAETAVTQPTAAIPGLTNPAQPFQAPTEGTAATLPSLQNQAALDLLANPNASPKEIAAHAYDSTLDVGLRRAAKEKLDKQEYFALRAPQVVSMIQGVQAGDPVATKEFNKQLTESKKNPDEGSVFKAVLAYLLKDEAGVRGELGKMGIGTTVASIDLGEGKKGYVHRDFKGNIYSGYDAEGNPLSSQQLSNASVNKVKAFGQLYKGSDGQNYTLDSNNNLINPVTKQAAPNNVTMVGTVTGEQQLNQYQQKKEIATGYKSADAMIKTNLDNEKLGVPPQYTQEQIEAAKRGETSKTGAVNNANNNNPGNIRYGDKAKSMGAIGQTSTGIAIFPDMASGDKAQNDLLSSDAYKNLNLHQIVSKWAPNNENNPAQYAKTVKSMLDGIDMDKTYNELSTDEKQKFREAQYKMEHGASVAPVEKVKSIAEKIADYEMKPPASRSAAYGPLMKEVLRHNPNYDETQYNVRNKTAMAFATGKEGQTLRSMNVAIDHLDTLQQAANALNNGDTQLFSKIGNSFAKQFGYPEVTNFDSVKSIVGSEVAKAISGSQMALEDRKDIRNVLSSWNSPDQTAGVVNQLQKLLAGQVNGLKTQYTSAGFTDDNFNKKLNPRTKSVLESINNSSQQTKTLDGVTYINDGNGWKIKK